MDDTTSESNWNSREQVVEIQYKGKQSYKRRSMVTTPAIAEPWKLANSTKWTKWEDGWNLNLKRDRKTSAQTNTKQKHH